MAVLTQHEKRNMLQNGGQAICNKSMKQIVRYVLERKKRKFNVNIHRLPIVQKLIVTVCVEKI